MDYEEEGLTLRQLVEMPEMASLWGQAQLVHPVLIDQVFGDGLQLIGFTTLNSRPAYYVLRGHSGWELNNQKWCAADPILDHICEIYEAIEAEWGNAYCGECNERYDNNECSGCEGIPESDGAFPALDAEGGCSWFAYDPLRR